MAEVSGAASEVGGLITSSQMEAYCRDGFVLCSGLVSAPIVDAAIDSLWQQMAGPPKMQDNDPWANEERARPRRGDRESWGGWAGIVDGPAVVSSFTLELIAVANALADAYEAASPFRSASHTIKPPPQSKCSSNPERD